MTFEGGWRRESDGAAAPASLHLEDYITILGGEWRVFEWVATFAIFGGLSFGWLVAFGILVGF